MRTKQPRSQKTPSALAPTNLARAARKVANYYRIQNFPGSPDAGLVQIEQEAVLSALREAVLDGGYRFQPLRKYITPKKDGSPRIETMSSALDRVLVQALLNGPGWQIQQQLTATATIGHAVVAPAYSFNKPQSWYIYTKWQNAFRSFKRINLQFARRHKKGHVLHLDIQQFYPSVSRDRMRGMLQPWFTADAWALLDRYLDFTAWCDGEIVPFGNGLPIEEPASRLFANLYLHPLDHFVIHDLGIPYTRYMDDMYFFLPTSDAAEYCRQRVTEFLALRLGLFINNGKNHDQPAKEYLAAAGTQLSQELSAVDHQMSVLPFCSVLRPGLEATLTLMLKGMPGPNANPEAEGHQQKITKAGFAAYRIAKLKLKGQEDELALLLQNAKTRYMAVVALCMLDTPSANKHLRRFLVSTPETLTNFELIRIAGTLLGNGKDTLLGLLEKHARTCPELLAIVRQGFGGPIQIRAGLRHDDALVRKAAALRLMSEPVKNRPLVEDLVMAARRENDRDVLAIFLLAAAQFSGNPETRALLVFMHLQKTGFIQRLAGALLKPKLNAVKTTTNTSKEIQPCHP